MQELQMIKCPSCKQNFPLKRKQLGYRICIECSQEKPKVAVNTVNGQGDHTWNDILIMEQEKAQGITKRAAELEGKQADVEVLDLDKNEDQRKRQIDQKIKDLLQSE
jgi:hypothetical protein